MLPFLDRLARRINTLSLWMLGALALVFAFGIGCSKTPPRIRTSLAHVVAPVDPDRPGQLDQSSATTTMPVPEKSTVTMMPSGEVVVTTSAPSQITQQAQRVEATTGTVSVRVAERKLEVAKETTLARHRMAIGAGLILLGLVVGFVLPGPMKWPLPGAALAGLGMVFVLMPDPPAWMIAIPTTLAIGAVLVYYIVRHSKND